MAQPLSPVSTLDLSSSPPDARPSRALSSKLSTVRESHHHTPFQDRHFTKRIVNRRSAFIEVGLEDDIIANDTGLSAIPQKPKPNQNLQRIGTVEKRKTVELGGTENKEESSRRNEKSWYRRIADRRRPHIKSSSNAPPGRFSSIPRVVLIAFLIFVVVPGIGYRGSGNAPLSGVGAGPVEKRANSPTNICTRWSHQSALVNGTLYVYGGRAKTSEDQKTDTWNNNLLTVDLTKSWERSSPALKGLIQPSGPPAVANGYLWNSYTSLFLYGGEFSDSPPASPVAFSTWEYDILSSRWTEHISPLTTAGNNSGPGNTLVQRSAEGAGLSVPELGLSWYFGGHQDMYTTAGWSNQVARIYLKSMLEFTHPGYQNTGVDGLRIGQGGAPSSGSYRNITTGGIEDTAGFAERADGVLVYVPGWGTQGILLGLAGGTSNSLTDMNNIDVYDIATSTWYKQATAGTPPSPRVNPCAVVFAAPDASSFQIHLYGGQNLEPTGGQTQYSDMWILTIPSFTWISVPENSKDEPAARAGHSCHARDGQMIVVGGYVGTSIPCDSPGIYVFNASSLAWSSSYTCLSSSSGISGGSSTGGTSNSDTDTGLEGSNGYTVPDAVQSVIGGGPYGSAAVTTPAAGTPTAGPIKTGKPPTFTVTQSGSTVTAEPTSKTSAAASSGTGNGGAIAAGTIAGILGLIAVYLAFCTWLYRRQVVMYKRHVAMSQRASGGYLVPSGAMMGTGGGGRSEKAGPRGPRPFLGAFGTEVPADMGTSEERSSGTSGERYDDWRSSEGQSYLMPQRTADTVHSQGGGYAWESSSDHDRRSIGSAEDLMTGQQMSFFNVVMSPRQTLRVINRD